MQSVPTSALLRYQINDILQQTKKSSKMKMFTFDFRWNVISVISHEVITSELG